MKKILMALVLAALAGSAGCSVAEEGGGRQEHHHCVACGHVYVNGCWPYGDFRPSRLRGSCLTRQEGLAIIALPVVLASGRSSVARTSRCQREGRQFKSGRPLH